jgi:hypothetical protein
MPATPKAEFVKRCRQSCDNLSGLFCFPDRLVIWRSLALAKLRRFQNPFAPFAE